MLALVDGDVVTYQCGFASDQTIYTAPDGAEFQYKKEAVQHCLDHKLDENDIAKNVEPEPVEHCLHSVKIFINSMLHEIDADEKKIFLTGGGQRRVDIFPEYKANRDETHKPYWYSEIHQYLQETHGADMIIGEEADDAMAWHQWADKATRDGDQLGAETCICTIDKDLNMVPGFHYNWKANGGKGDLFWVDETVANRLFFEQWLSGDTADNIPGIPGVGPIKAQKILAGVGDDPFLMYEKVINEWSGPPVVASAPACQSVEEYVHLIGDLLWMQRVPGETWDQHFGLTDLRNDNECLF